VRHFRGGNRPTTHPDLDWGPSSRNYLQVDAPARRRVLLRRVVLGRASAGRVDDARPVPAKWGLGLLLTMCENSVDVIGEAPFDEQYFPEGTPEDAANEKA
jgi:hypothetical protein